MLNYTKKIKTKKLFYGLLFLMLILFSSNFAFAQNTDNSEKNCAIYITGIGCANCAKTDGALFTEILQEYPDLIIIEYWFYLHQPDKTNNSKSNYNEALKYFNNYILEDQSPGVPFLIFNKNNTALGLTEILNIKDDIKNADSNKCPMPDGEIIDFDKLNLNNIKGNPNIWSKNRILIPGTQDKQNNELLKTLLTTNDIDNVLKRIEYKKIEPRAIEISNGEIYFENAVKINNSIFQWNIKTNDKDENLQEKNKTNYSQIIFGFVILCLLITYRKNKLSEKQKNLMIVIVSILLIAGFFIFAKNISGDFIKQIGYDLPLPVFTFIIALIDGFNPCNLFVLTLLLGLLISASHNKKRIFIIGGVFVMVVYLFYFLFMLTWLNIFKYIGFISSLRIGIGLLAIIAGLINCKELFFYRKGITLMIQDRHKAPLMKKINAMKQVIKNGSLPLLITSSVVLAIFTSFVELPCTAGFPIIYVAILSRKVLENRMIYFLYLLFYNLIYVLPLIAIIIIFGNTLKSKQITKEQMKIIKFIGGFIMILLGIVLLFNPHLIGL